jgi:hypothetical protein
MADTEALTKRVAISKSNAQMVAVVAVASFVTIFCLVASKTILSENAYQQRVLDAKNKAHQQLLSNINAYSSLTQSYEKFVSKPTNVIGGQNGGNGSKDGNNAKIILDALPPSYDFPALTSSIENILLSNGLQVTDISGTDNQLNEQNNNSSPNPQPVSMPFSFTISNTNYQAVGQLVTALQNSIRPISIDTMNVTGGGSDMSVTITAHTYYQPSKSLSITKQVVK